MPVNKSGFGVFAKLLDVFGLSDKPAGFKPLPGVAYRGYGHDIYSQNAQIGQDWESRKRDWLEMANHDIIQAAGNLYAEEATVCEQKNPAIVWVEAEDSTIQAKLNKMLNAVRSEDVAFSQSYHIAMFGNLFEKLEAHPGEGIVGSVFVPLESMERVWDERRTLIGFRWQDKNPAEGQLWKPWDFIHFRRLGAHRSSEWGEAVIEAARSVFRKFSMIEGAIISYRLNMNPNRLHMNIDTGESDPYNQMRILEDWKRTLLANQYVNQDAKKFENIYNPPAFEAMMFSARNADDKSAITTLQGDAKFPEIADYNVLFQRMAGALGIPPAYLGWENELSAKNLLIQEDVRFARKILSIRKPLIAGYTRLCEIHLAYLDIDPKKVKFKVMMSHINPLDAQMRAELVSKQLEVISALADIGDGFGVNKADWFKYLFVEYMCMPKDIVELFVQSINNASLMTSSQNVDRASTSRLEEEMRNRINLKGASLKKIKEEIDRRVEKDAALHDIMESVKDLAKSHDFLKDSDLKSSEGLPNAK